MAINYDIVKPRIGAAVHADRAQLRDPDFARECLELLDERAVLVFPEIGLTDEEQLAFTDMLGERSVFASRVPTDDGEETEFYKITLDPKIKKDNQYVLATFFWHMDGVTVESDPPKATLLSARQVSAEGGETEFANTFAAYEALPDKEKARLESLRVVHSVYAGVRPILDYSVTPEEWGGESVKTEQPLVWTHESGRKSLLLGVQMESIVGMELVEGRALISRLLEWATQPEFKYRHKWSEGDLVIWKNLGAMHRVIPYDAASGRLMHRTSLANMKVAA
ncbi:MAG: TauD/TfdA family dioxygenase [Novosphingobium sp.]|nr:TauD/TfdA family dioxygenase [Novosphingobium sp.]